MSYCYKIQGTQCRLSVVSKHKSATLCGTESEDFIPLPCEE